MTDRVILLHGLGRSPLSFLPMARRLRRSGYQVRTPIYFAPRGNIRVLTRSLRHELGDSGKVSFVGHSLGGLLALRLWHELPPRRRGRLVQLGSPNLGSEVARRTAFLSPLIGPVLKDLEPRELPIIAPSAIGAIAGSAGPRRLATLTGLEGPNDGFVTVESALAAAPQHRLVLPVIHTFIMVDGRVIDAVEHFLKTGSFADQTALRQSA